MNWWVLVAILAGIAFTFLVGVYLLIRRLRDREPYATILRLRTRQKITFFRRLITDPRLPRRVRIIPIALAIYLAFPVDLIPDFIPVIGYLDDVGMVILALVLIVRLTPAGLVREIASGVESPANDDFSEPMSGRTGL